MGSVQNCTLASCTIKEALCKSCSTTYDANADLETSVAAKNATATLCGMPIRDNAAVTPIVTGVSGAVAIICVILRVGDRFPHIERLQWSDLAVVLSLVSSTFSAASL